MEAKRGGARPGAGRPKSEPTTMVRVPDGCLEVVRHLISVYRETGSLPVSEPCGDSHKQVELPLASQASAQSAPVPEPVVPPSDPELSTAAQAWSVYIPLLSQYRGYADLKKRFLKFADYDGGYSYLFMLQLLERLAKMSDGPEHVPYEWISTNALRDFARKLYKANPQWH
ncbi:hypothetical protein [Aeromonas veronii]|uniref:hypothetical protein n=1 Tax=Aeromonas veronii TaxID=654 RepID=UPI001115EA39|nr:hypothetical protein [Aeromonas veronii]